MNSEQFIWRKRARVIGYINIVLCGMSTFASICTLFGAIVVTAVAVVIDSNSIRSVDLLGLVQINRDNDSAVAIFMWAFFGIVISTTIFETWAAMRLLDATEVGCELSSALRLARFWRTITLAVMVITSLCVLFAGRIIAAVCASIGLVVLGAFVGVVTQFMGELEIGLAGGGGIQILPQCKASSQILQPRPVLRMDKSKYKYFGAFAGAIVAVCIIIGLLVLWTMVHIVRQFVGELETALACGGDQTVLQVKM